MTLSDFRFPDAEDEGDCRMLHNIATVGWEAIHIPAEGNLPGHSFTVGLYYTFGHPEALITGLNPELSHSIFNTLVDLINDNRGLQEGVATQDLIERHRCQTATVPFPFYQEYLGYAQWFYSGQAFPTFQIIWPDRQGILPGESGYDRQFLARQVVLADLPSWPFPGCPPNQEAAASRTVLEGQWISQVIHRVDGSWQFNSSGPAPFGDDIKLVSLDFMFKLDSTLAWIGGLPPGWRAWRETPEKSWRRDPHHQET